MGAAEARNFRKRRAKARCLINKDAEGEIPEKSVEAHCLITEDTVANGKNHEPIHPRRIPENDALPIPALHWKAS